MPLKPGSSQDVISANIEELMLAYKTTGKIGNTTPRDAEHARKIAAAIAYQEAHKGNMQKAASSRKDDEGDGKLKRVAKGFGALTLLNIPAMGAQYGLGEMAGKIHSTPVVTASIDDVKHMIHKHDLTSHVDIEHGSKIPGIKHSRSTGLGHMSGAHFVPPVYNKGPKGFVTSSGQSADVLMHELGHATTSKKLGRAYDVAHMAARNITRKGYLDLAGLGMLTNDETSDKAWVPSAIGHGSVIAEEMGANLHAAKSLYHSGGAKKALKYLAKSSPALGTYVASAAVPVGGLHLANKWINHGHKDSATLEKAAYVYERIYSKGESGAMLPKLWRFMQKGSREYVPTK